MIISLFVTLLSAPQISGQSSSGLKFRKLCQFHGPCPAFLTLPDHTIFLSSAFVSIVKGSNKFLILRLYRYQMRHFLLILALFSGLAVAGQVHVTIQPAMDTVLCYNDSIALTTTVTGAGTSTIWYQWQKNGSNIQGATDSLYAIGRFNGKFAGFYRCIITVNGLTDTSNVVQLQMHPRMFFDTLYRYNELGCRKDCKGQFKALVSGGTRFSAYPPYQFEWHGGFSQDTIVFGLCTGKYQLTVTDSMGCHIDTMYVVDALKSPKVNFDIKPDDTTDAGGHILFLTNPNLQVVYPDSMKQYISNWNWDFGDTTTIPDMNPAYHTYDRTGQFLVKLNFTDINGCDTTITRDLEVKVADLNITKVLTLNGDAINEQFKITIKEHEQLDFNEAYLNTELIVFDRWGKKVYDRKDFKSKDWDGGNLSDGTYYYILRCHGQYSDEVFKGSVTILH